MPPDNSPDRIDLRNSIKTSEKNLSITHKVLKLLAFKYYCKMEK